MPSPPLYSVAEGDVPPARRGDVAAGGEEGNAADDAARGADFRGKSSDYEGSLCASFLYKRRKCVALWFTYTQGVS